MPRIDYVAEERDIDSSELIRALLTVIAKQFNTLRALHGLPAITKDQVLNAIKEELRK